MLLTSFGVAQLIGSRQSEIFLGTKQLTNQYQALFGWLADQSASRRTPLLWGFISNAAASVLLCFATNVWLLLLSRFLQGLSAAVVYTVGFALLADTVGSKDIGQWMGYVVASLNVGMAMSPVLGGILFEKAGYMSLFYVIFGLIGLDILLRLVMIEKKVAKKWVKPLVSKPCGIVSDYGTLQTSQDQAAYEQESDSRKLSNSEDQSIDSVEDSDVSSAEDNIYHTDPPLMTQPSLPLFTLIKSIRILTDIYGTLITVTLLVAFDTALPLFVERTFGWGSLGGGLIFLPITIPILASPLAGRLADTTNPRWLAITGNILAGFFTALLLLISHNSTKQVILIFVLLALYGGFLYLTLC